MAVNKIINKVHFEDLGLIDYKQAWDYQQKLNKELIERKRSYIKSHGDLKNYEGQHYLLCCEHLPVYTLGKSGSPNNLLLNELGLEKEKISYYKINRGGDITYHGPGQVVIYPIFDLECFFTDVHKYVRALEEVIIRTLKEFGLNGIREEGFTGVWLKNEANGEKNKVCAIGVHLSRWVSLHGLAFNVNTNLDHFKHIIPCGISDNDRKVSSLSKELGNKQEMELVKLKIKAHFAALFEFDYV